MARTLALALEQVGRADTGIGYLYGITFALCSTFAMECNFNEELCSRVAPIFCDAEDIVLGSLVLPVYARSDSSSGPMFRGRYLQAAARFDGSEWVISGEKFVP